MGTVTLTGNDTILLNRRVISDLADADAATLGFPNEIASIKTGKNGNSIFALNESGKQCKVVLRVIRGSADDKYFNALLAQQQANFVATVLLSGEFIKKIGDGKGNVIKDTYIMSGGVFTKQVDAKSNAEGDVEQGISIYNIDFSNAPRAIS